MASLAFYLSDCASLLHDQSFLFTSKAQLTRWINTSRRQAAYRTACVRRLITGQSAFGANSQPGSFIPGGAQPGALPDGVPLSVAGAFGAAVGPLQTIPGVERYPYVGFFNPAAKAQHAGIEGIMDIDNLAVNWGGAVRPTLAWLPWSDLQSYARAYSTLVTSFPYYYSIYNDGGTGEVWMFPAPSTVGDIEADAYCIPADLNSNDDYDVIPQGFENAIKFGAASLAYMTKQNWSQAQIMEGLFNSHLGIGGVARDRGKIPNAYFSNF